MDEKKDEAQEEQKISSKRRVTVAMPRHKEWPPNFFLKRKKKQKNIASRRSVIVAMPRSKEMGPSRPFLL